MSRVRVAFVLATLACIWLTTTKLHLSSDLSALFPDSGDAAALVRFSRVFGGRDPALVLVRGDSPQDVSAVAESVAESLRHSASIARVLDRAPSPEPPRDPTTAWAYAGPEARRRLAALVTPSGMRARLEASRALLLAPAGSDDLESWLARDPLRLGQILSESRTELIGNVAAGPGEAFSADGGRARLVVAEPRGSAFVSEDARALVEDVARAESLAARPGVTTELAGGHAIAWATEGMLKRDLEVSGTLSVVLASLAFVATFRRARALAALLPPLLLGTLWTTGIAALFPAGLSAVAIAFAAVVVGVGVDTGVHVYSALLDARRDGKNPWKAAAQARAVTWRPTLVAAAVAATAFASLALGGLRALRQLGLLCGAGELLTAIAILLVTPEIGAWFEQGPPPPARAPRWVDGLVWTIGTRRRSIVALVASAVPVVVIAIAGWPEPADALVAVRPKALEPLVVEDRIRAIFGGKDARAGQSIVLTADADEERARTRADRVEETLERATADGSASGFDSLTTFAPSVTTKRLRLAERDALDLPSRRSDLAAALRETGFALDAFQPALDALSGPSQDVSSASPRAGDPSGALSWVFARHLAHEGGQTLVATYARVTGDPTKDARLRGAILEADPGSQVTGLYAIDRALRAILERDLVVVGGVALIVVAVAMRLALRSARHALVAMLTLACEMAVVGVAMRLLSVRWHVYDALVLPVLFGVTVDESMFLLDAARRQPLEDALRAQAPLVAATALTTAAGFAALIPCRFDGLRDLGLVGTLGVLAGLVAALVVVPATLRLMRPMRPSR